jgi:hypothetical protein
MPMKRRGSLGIAWRFSRKSATKEELLKHSGAWPRLPGYTESMGNISDTLRKAWRFAEKSVLGGVLRLVSTTWAKVPGGRESTRRRCNTTRRLW